MEGSNVEAMREALETVRKYVKETTPDRVMLGVIEFWCNEALAAPPHTGKWKNGKKYEYEYAYCSACGHMQWAGWDTHKQAAEDIENFAEVYKFCPNCGAKMEGGVYVK